jgi:hypothetical protein
MPANRIRVLQAFLCVALLGCSGRNSLSIKPDARTAGDPSDAASASDLPADTPPDVAMAPDLPMETRAASEDLGDAGGDPTYADACEAVANSTFLSLAELECGRTQTGVATCQWGLSFTDNGATRQVSWRHSDYVMTLSYACSGFTVTATSASGEESTYTGKYDPATRILTWDGVQYSKVIR